MSDTKRFTFEVDNEVGALERVLSVARRRGLEIEKVVVEARGPRLAVEIRAGGPASEVTLAMAQWSALVDVRRATMEE